LVDDAAPLAEADELFHAGVGGRRLGHDDKGMRL
jgi:hypothetical protein